MWPAIIGAVGSIAGGYLAGQGGGGGSGAAQAWAANNYQGGIDAAQSGLAVSQGLHNYALSNIMGWAQNNQPAISGQQYWGPSYAPGAPTNGGGFIPGLTGGGGGPNPYATSAAYPGQSGGFGAPTYEANQGLMSGALNAGHWMSGQAVQLAAESGLAGTMLTDRLVNRAGQTNLAELSDRYRRDASAASARADAQAQEALARANASRGVGPGSAASLALGQQAAIQQAGARARAMTDASYQAEARRDQIEATALAANAQRAEQARIVGTLGVENWRTAAGLNEAELSATAGAFNTVTSAGASVEAARINAASDAGRQSFFQAQANVLPITTLVELIDTLDANVLAGYGLAAEAHVSAAGGGTTLNNQAVTSQGQQAQSNANLLDNATNLLTSPTFMDSLSGLWGGAAGVTT